MPARSVCLVALSLSEGQAGPGRFGGQVSVTGIGNIYHNIHSLGVNALAAEWLLHHLYLCSSDQPEHACAHSTLSHRHLFYLSLELRCTVLLVCGVLVCGCRYGVLVCGVLMCACSWCRVCWYADACAPDQADV